ncbi:hypothetical protein GWN42_13610 [candidate division KSB1 bacterium]|nr:hypothetical protein [candidate division KSB1 bacterium]
MIDMLSHFADEMVTASHVAGDAGTYTDGEWVPDLDSGVDVSIVFPQPLNMRQLQQLDPGERVQNFVQTWTKANIRVREGNRDSDRITFDGRTFLVYQVEDRTFPGEFKHCILREITPDE